MVGSHLLLVTLHMRLQLLLSETIRIGDKYLLLPLSQIDSPYSRNFLSLNDCPTT